jgi:hypothetical protein
VESVNNGFAFRDFTNCISDIAAETAIVARTYKSANGNDDQPWEVHAKTLLQTRCGSQQTVTDSVAYCGAEWTINMG